MMAKKVTKKNTAKSAKRGTIVLTRQRLLLWICGGIGISAWMFFLGVMVGRGTSPVRFDVKTLQKELAVLKETLLQKEKEEAEHEAKKLSKKPDLNFYETLTGKKEQARLKNNNDVVSAPVEIKQPKPKPITKKEETVAAKKEGKMTIQVVSLRDSSSAEKLTHRLRKKGYDAYRAIAKIPKKGTWYRVYVGHFKSSHDAQKMLARLRVEEKLDPIVVTDPRVKENKEKNQRR